MGVKVTFSKPGEEGDVEGHAYRSCRREIEVSEMRMVTSDGDELRLEPEGEDGERWKVVDGPDDLIGHAARAGR